MRIASLALTIASAAIVIGLLAHPADRAAADYNISGDWVFVFDDGTTCTGTFSETKPVPFYDAYDLTLILNCEPSYTLLGVLYPFDGSIGLSLQVNPVSGMAGTVSNGGHLIEGYTYTYYAPSLSGTFPFTATGGDGDPKLGTDTPLPSVTSTPTPPAVGGVAFDAAARSGGALDARWLIAITGASFAALGGAGLYARGRRRLGGGGDPSAALRASSKGRRYKTTSDA